MGDQSEDRTTDAVAQPANLDARAWELESAGHRRGGTMPDQSARKILAATFTTPDGGSRAAGAIASKLRDSGFKNDQLEQLGKSLGPNSSAVVVEIASDAVDTAKGLLEPLGPGDVVVEEVDSSVATLFDEEAEPTPEPEPAATAPPG